MTIAIATTIATKEPHMNDADFEENPLEDLPDDARNPRDSSIPPSLEMRARAADKLMSSIYRAFGDDLPKRPELSQLEARLIAVQYATLRGKPNRDALEWYFQAVQDYADVTLMEPTW
jgi:hypothetical protein